MNLNHASVPVIWQMAMEVEGADEDFARHLITEKRQTRVDAALVDADYPEDAAKAVAEGFWRDSRALWAENFGDDDSASVLLRIYEPADIAGDYAIDLSFEIRACAGRIDRPASADQEDPIL